MPPSRRILLATGNEHKAAEMRAILSPLLANVEMLTLRDVGIESVPEEVEAWETFAENAIAKANWCRDRSGLDCIADDSGLCVDSLNGRPGVRSARWAGPTDADRNRHLLSEMRRAQAITPDRRGAKFICNAAYAPTRGETVVRDGELLGVILMEVRGENGFGYDPLFYVPSLAMTFAQAGASIKNVISHRAQAMRGLASYINQI